MKDAENYAAGLRERQARAEALRQIARQSYGCFIYHAEGCVCEPEPLEAWQRVDVPEHVKPALLELQKVAETFVDRGRKYGPGNIAEWGWTGILVRLGDKYARLKNSAEDFEDESVADTLRDIIGYALIGLSWRDGDWPGSQESFTPPF